MARNPCGQESNFMTAKTTWGVCEGWSGRARRPTHPVGTLGFTFHPRASYLDTSGATLTASPPWLIRAASRAAIGRWGSAHHSNRLHKCCGRISFRHMLDHRLMRVLFQSKCWVGSAGPWPKPIPRYHPRSDGSCLEGRP